MNRSSDHQIYLFFFYLQSMYVFTNYTARMQRYLLRGEDLPATRNHVRRVTDVSVTSLRALIRYITASSSRCLPVRRRGVPWAP